MGLAEEVKALAEEEYIIQGPEGPESVKVGDCFIEKCYDEYEFSARKNRPYSPEYNFYYIKDGRRVSLLGRFEPWSGKRKKKKSVMTRYIISRIGDKYDHDFIKKVVKIYFIREGSKIMH